MEIVRVWKTQLLNVGVENNKSKQYAEEKHCA